MCIHPKSSSSSSSSSSKIAERGSAERAATSGRRNRRNKRSRRNRYSSLSSETTTTSRSASPSSNRSELPSEKRKGEMAVPTTVVALKKVGIRGGDSSKYPKGGNTRSHSSMTAYRQPKYHLQKQRSQQQLKPLGLLSEEEDCHSSSSSADASKKCRSRPKGLTNVGNTCYANAVLQCLLSTALTSALLDPKTAPIVRGYASNRRILAMGSGSVASSDNDSDAFDNDDDSTIDYGCIDDIDINEIEELLRDNDESFSSKKREKVPRRVLYETQSVSSLTESQRQKLKKVAKMRKKRKEAGRTIKEEKAAKRKEQERQRMSDNCDWLTRELTSIAEDYILRGGREKGGRRGSAEQYLSSSPTSVIDWLSSACGQTLGSSARMIISQKLNEPESYGVVNPGSITRHPDRLSPCLSPYQQEDAHEFMRALISNLVMNGQNRELSSLFDGLLESSVTCQTCGRASLTRDRYMDLSVDINNADVHSLDDALFEFTKEEILKDDNAVFCQRCQQKQAVTKGLRLATAPSMLVCHLKRFAFNDYGRLVRLHKRIAFPQKLEIGDYMSDLNMATPPPYDLVGVLVHQGQTCASGHYLSFVKRNGDWFKCNDSVVSKVEESTVMSQQAYILMYEVAGMREKNPCLAQPQKAPFTRKELDVLSTIESHDDAATVSVKSYYSASSRSNGSRLGRTKSAPLRGTYQNPYGASRISKNKEDCDDETKTESFFNYITDICGWKGNTISSSNSSINEPNTSKFTNNENTIVMNNRTRQADDSRWLHRSEGRAQDIQSSTHSNMRAEFGRRGSQRSLLSHECESVATHDSFMRKESLLTRKTSPINVLDVPPNRRKSKNQRKEHRSQTAPRQRSDSSQDATFVMVEPFTTYTPRAGDVARDRRALLQRMDSASIADSVTTKSTTGTLYQHEREERRGRQAQNKNGDHRRQVSVSRYSSFPVMFQI